MKICAKCDQEKPLSEFHKGKRYADGHQSYCKRCAKALERRIAQLHERTAAIQDQVSVLTAARAELESYDCVTEIVQHHRIFAFASTADNTTFTAGAY